MGISFKVRVPAALVTATALSAQQFPIPTPSERELARANYHRVTSKDSPAREPGAENTSMLSPLERPDGSRVKSAEEWYGQRRPELLGSGSV